VAELTQQDGGERFPNIFKPIKIGPVEMRNRIFMAPHGIPLETPVAEYGSHNQPAAEHAFYFAERAAGGVGLIFHSMQIGPFAAQPNLAASPGLTEAVPSYRRVAEMVHEAGAKIMAEIWYVPWQPHRWEALGPEAPQLAPSAVQNFHVSTVRRAMRKADMDRLKEAHRVATRNLMAAGYDGVELHVSHGSILEYFLTPYFNHRTDEYGGSLENRARLLCETLAVVREEAGSKIAVGIRLTTDELLPGAYDTDGAKEILQHLAPTGLLDFVDLDISVEPEQAYLMTTGFFEPKLHNLNRVKAVSAAARPLVVLAAPGRLTSLADAERMLASGVVDLVGAVRGLIAEPELVKNAREGKASRNRICIAANHCTGGTGIPLGGSFGCAINAAAGREERWGVKHQERAPRLTRVVVVGGGPAGLEAARVAAIRGHHVTLLERSSALGGGLALWAQIPGRESLATLPAWFEGRFAEVGVDVRLGVEADVASILALNPEVVIVATGSHYERTGETGFVPRPIPGWDHDFVHPPEPIIRGDVKLSGNVLVLDEEGMHAAVGAAEIAAIGGAKVELVTRWPTVAHYLAAQARYIPPRLRAAGVTMSTGTFLKEIRPGEVTLTLLATGEERRTHVDAVVLATMRKPDDELGDSLEGMVPYVYVIGDALAPRTLKEATYEGQRFARVIGEDTMPKSVTEELFKPLNSLRPAAMA
jgi:2,4-dienoyl-CoA reductase-like NADH-dependent reductase (Old Yellow Enzyme family)/thioredoxin reductase